MTVCEVCHSETARYRCPRCDRRSCRSDKSALLVGSVWAITYAYFLYYLVCLVLRNTRKFSVAVERETKRATFPFQSSPMRSCVVVSWTHGFFIFLCAFSCCCPSDYHFLEDVNRYVESVSRDPVKRAGHQRVGHSRQVFDDVWAHDSVLSTSHASLSVVSSEGSSQTQTN